MTSADDKFADRLQEVRSAQGVSQAALADRMSARGYKRFKQQTIDRIESGERRAGEDTLKRRKVTYGEASDLAACLGYTLDELTSGGSELLLRQGAIVDIRMSDLVRASHLYVEAMFGYAKSADERSEQLHDSVRRYLEDALSRQTPSLLVRDAHGVVAAAIQRANIEAGPHVSAFRDALKRDLDLLERYSDASS